MSVSTPNAVPVLVTGVTPTRTLRQMRAVLSWKGAEFLGLGIFTLAVPRLMGPVQYGRYATVLALVSLLLTACSMGGLVTFGRFLPQYLAQGDWPMARALFVEFFWARAVLASMLALLSAFAIQAVLTDASWQIIAATAGAVFLGASATTCFQVFYGLNALGRSSAQDGLLRLALVALLLLLGGMQSLERAVEALLLAQLGLMMLGLVWTRSLFRGERQRFSFSFLIGHLRFGLLFFLPQLVLVAMWRSGEILILKLSGRSDEVAFFSVANAVTMALSMLLIQLGGVLIPRLTTLHLAGEQDGVAHATSLAMKYLVIVPVLGVYALWAIGPWSVELLMGPSYRPLVADLKVLAFGLPAAGLLGIGLSLAVVRKQPGRILLVNAVGFATFVALSFALVPAYGSLGACVALVVGMMLAVVVACFQFRLVSLIGRARLAQLVGSSVAGMAFAALPIVGFELPLGLLAATLFLGLLFRAGLVSFDEVRNLVRGIAA